MFRRRIILIFAIFIFSFICNITSKKNNKVKGTFFDIERPKFLLIDNTIFRFMNVTCQRRSRRDHIHYMNLYFDLLKPLHNNDTKHEIYFFQLLSNKYKRSFVEITFKLCEAFDTYLSFFKTAYFKIPVDERPMKQNDCPLLPGYYRLENMSVNPDMIPEHFPFEEGRIYYNVTHLNKRIVAGYLDFKLRTFH